MYKLLLATALLSVFISCASKQEKLADQRFDDFQRVSSADSEQHRIDNAEYVAKYHYSYLKRKAAKDWLTDFRQKKQHAAFLKNCIELGKPMQVDKDCNFRQYYFLASKKCTSEDSLKKTMEVLIENYFFNISHEECGAMNDIRCGIYLYHSADDYRNENWFAMATQISGKPPLVSIR